MTSFNLECEHGHVFRRGETEVYPARIIDTGFTDKTPILAVVTFPSPLGDSVVSFDHKGVSSHVHGDGILCDNVPDSPVVSTKTKKVTVTKIGFADGSVQFILDEEGNWITVVQMSDGTFRATAEVVP